MRGRLTVAIQAFVLATATGCRDDEFRCNEDAQCPDDGQCELTGFCSIGDETCPSGRRYTEFSGSLAGECVAEDVAGTEGGSSGATTSSGSGEPTSTPSSSTTTAPPGSEDSSSGPTTTGNDDPLLFVDDDEEDFGAGTAEMTAYADGLRLQDGATMGGFLSRVFDAGETVTWTEFSWIPRGPYAKALPDGGMDEAGYAEGNISMADNVLLLHFDVGPGLMPGDDVPETSGRMQAVSLEGTAPAGAAAGAMFRGGIALTAETFAQVDASATTDFQFGETDFTWSMWARTQTPCYDDTGTVSVNQVFMGIEEGGGTGGAHMWLGCYNPANTRCGAVVGGGRLGSTITAAQGDGIGGTCADQGPELVDGQWHHLALVKRGHADATLTIWFDGVPVDTADAGYILPISFSDDRPFQIGRLSDSFRSTVDLDEMAVFRRAFEPDEVVDLHLRGALRLSFQVRACETPTCDDAEFIGPGGQVETVIADADAGASIPLPQLQGRYFQYIARFSRTGPELAREPILDEVRIAAAPN